MAVVTPSRRLAVIAQIDGNIDALSAVLDDCRAVGVHKIICLGNLVGAGPDSVACLAAARKAGVVAVRGCHDHAANDQARAAVTCHDGHRVLLPLGWTKLRRLLAWRCSRLPRIIRWGPDVFVHGTPTDPLTGCVELGRRPPKALIGLKRFLFRAHDPGYVPVGVVTLADDSLPEFDSNVIDYGMEDWCGVGFWSAPSLGDRHDFNNRRPAIITVGSVSDEQAHYVLVDGDTVSWRTIAYDRRRLDALRRNRMMALLTNRDADAAELRLAIKAACALASPEAISALSELLRHGDTNICMMACSALGELGDPAAIPDLINLLANDVASRRGLDAESAARLRTVAIDALAQVGGSETLAALVRVRDDAERSVRDAARRALKGLGHRPDPIERRLRQMIGEPGGVEVYGDWLREQGHLVRAEYLSLRGRSDSEAVDRRQVLRIRLGRWCDGVD